MIKIPLKSLLVSVHLATALLLLSIPLAAQAEGEDARPTLVKIHANWCGTCQRIESTWEELKTSYGERANFVVFDVTDRAALQKSQAEAERLGLTNVLDEYKSSTGTIAIIGPDGETLDVFKGVTDAERYEGALGQACNS